MQYESNHGKIEVRNHNLSYWLLFCHNSKADRVEQPLGSLSKPLNVGRRCFFCFWIGFTHLKMKKYCIVDFVAFHRGLYVYFCICSITAYPFFLSPIHSLIGQSRLAFETLALAAMALTLHFTFTIKASKCLTMQGVVRAELATTHTHKIPLPENRALNSVHTQPGCKYLYKQNLEL